MRKLLLVAFVLLLSTASFAQVADNPTNTNDMQTNFSYIGAFGNNGTANPGYIALQSHDQGDNPFTYYLWVDNTGDLRIASYPTISAYSSFPTGDWSLPEFAAGTVVGSQS